MGLAPSQCASRAMSLHIQFRRYAIVGIVSNVAGYVLYLLITWLGVGPKMAMTSIYLVGVLQTFVFNRRWSFEFAGATTPALVRYATAYASGYVINFLALMLFVDKGGLPHRWVQGAMILVVAVMLFMAQRYWVFPGAAARDMA